MKVYTRVVMDWDGNILEEDSYDYEGPVAHAGGGGGTAKSEQKSKPWEGVVNYVAALNQNIWDLAQEHQDFFPDQTYAGFTPLQEEGMYGGLDYMRGPYADQAAQFMGDLRGMMDAPGNITNLPAVQAMMDANRAATTDVLEGEWLPNIQRKSIGMGDYGGTKTDILRGQAMGDAADALAQANARTMMDAYLDATRQATVAAQMTPGAMSLGMAPFQTAEKVGAMEQAMEQQGIDEAMARHYFPLQERWGRLQKAMSLYTPQFGFGTTETKQKMGGGSALGGALGGGLMGYGLATSVPGLSGYAWPMAAGGAALGGLLN